MRRNAFLTVLLLSASSLIPLRSATQESADRLTMPASHGFDRTQSQSDEEGYQLAQPGSSDVTWSLAATGDTVSTRRVSVYETYPGFKSLVAVIRAADAGFTNLETSLFRMADFSGYPQAESGGIWFVGPPEVAQDIK